MENELEKSREVRRIGLRNVLVGGILAGAAGVALYVASAVASASSVIIGALAVVLMVGLYGLWRLVKGVVYLVRPQAEHRSVPEMTQSELIE